MKYRVKRHTVCQPLGTDYRLIPLTQHQNSIVDAADFERLNQYHWCALWNKCIKGFYAVRNGPLNSLIYMHRQILCCERLVDHKNHDTLDNRRNNLREASYSQNQANRGLPRSNKSGYKGIILIKDYKKWRAEISVNGKSVSLGYFESKEDAARAYDEAAKKYHGKFARLNFPLSGEHQ